MSSLRLALKQSLQEAAVGVSPAFRTKKTKDMNLNTTNNNEESEWGAATASSSDRTGSSPSDAPRRKRGRPRKYPPPEDDDDDDDDTSQQHSQQSRPERQDSEDCYSSSENEFSLEAAQRNGGREEGESSEEDQQNHPHDRHSAAHKIQSHWKSKKQQQRKPAPVTDSPKAASAAEEALLDESNRTEQSSSPSAVRNKSTKKMRPKTVPPPDPLLLAWQRQLPIRHARVAVTAGMRVKVRFSTAARDATDKRKKKKRKWFGGRVSTVSKEGSKIRIKYDDGTIEVTKFPDKDIVVDDAANGRHQVAADEFLPRDAPLLESASSAAATTTTTTTLPDEPSKEDDATEGLEVPFVDPRKNDQQDVAMEAVVDVAERADPQPLIDQASKEDATTMDGLRGSITEEDSSLKQAQLESSLSNNPVESKDLNTNLVDTQQDVPVKRKRGRPPKHRPSLPTVTVTEIEVNEVSGSLQQEEGEELDTENMATGISATRDEITANVETMGELKAAPSRSTLTIRIPLPKMDAHQLALKGLSPKRTPMAKSFTAGSMRDDGKAQQGGTQLLATSNGVDLAKASGNIDAPNQEPALKRIRIHMSASDSELYRSTTPHESEDDEEVDHGDMAELRASPIAYLQMKKMKRNHLETEDHSDRSNDVSSEPYAKMQRIEHLDSDVLGRMDSDLLGCIEGADTVPVGSSHSAYHEDDSHNLLSIYEDEREYESRGGGKVSTKKTHLL
jgi:hypothetical protein